MVLTRGDDFPIHQTAEPIAYAGTDRNFYDRYFFNGYGMEGDLFFAAAFGVYPHLNIADAAFSIVDDGVETSLHASKWLNMERMDLTVGPISIEVLEPLQKLRLKVDAADRGIRAELTFEGRAFPIEEPRFIRRNGPRTFMDYTRLTQNGRWSGWLERDGKRQDVAGFMGTRDRSWGIRPIGARDEQAAAPPMPPQFFWIWSPCNFPSGSFFFHTNDEASGAPWNRRAVWAPEGADAEGLREIHDCNIAIDWKSGTRHAKSATVTLKDPSGTREIVFEPQFNFFMHGIGYGHPHWGHGANKGQALAVEREDLKLADVNVSQPGNLHIQAISKVTYRDGRGGEQVGRGVLEQLAMGPHAPSGFKSILDMAP